MLKNEKGSMTIFLFLMSTVIIFVILIFLEFLYLKSFKVELKKSIEISAESVLANYSNYIARKYNIYVYKNNIKKEELYYYIKNNINEMYRLENLSFKIDFKGKLDENENLKRQIIKFSKVKTPEKVVKSFLNNFKNIKNKNKDVKEIDRILAYNKKLHKVAKLRKKIKSDISILIYKEILFDIEDICKSIYLNIKKIEEIKEKLDILKKDIEESKIRNLNMAEEKRILKIINKNLNYIKKAKKNEVYKDYIIKNINYDVKQEISKNEYGDYKEHREKDERESIEKDKNKKIQLEKSTIKIESKVFKKLPSQKNISNNNVFNREYNDIFKSFNTMFKVNVDNPVDKILINEYILDHFNNKIKVINDESFLENEVEYILSGDKSDYVNRKNIENQLFGIRFTLNFISLYKNPEKQLEAYKIAVAVSGWISSGCAVPFIKNMIIVSFAYKESKYDITEIYKGEKIKVFKLPGDFKKVKISKNKNLKSKLEFGYEDYLRLFLFFKSEEKILNRVKDIIQMNVSQRYKTFNIENMYTKFKLTVDSRCRYIFSDKVKKIEESIIRGF